MRILLIGTDSEQLASLRDDLLRAGCQCAVATEIREALWHIRNARPDLLFIHYESEGVPLWEALRGEGVTLPAILLLPEAMQTVPRRFLALGVADYITLPCEPSQLRAAIAQAANLGMAEREREELRRALEEARQTRDRQLLTLTALYGFGRSLGRLMDQQTLLEYVVESAVHLTAADQGCVLIEDAEQGRLQVGALRGIGPYASPESRLRVEESLAQLVMQTGEPLLIADGSDLNEEVPSTGIRLHSLLNVPLKIGERLLGVLSVANKSSARAFGEEDLLLLTILADFAALSLENARLHSESQQRTATEIFRQTVATLAHHVNNPLAALLAGVHTLSTHLGSPAEGRADDTTRRTLETLAEKAEEIAAVIAVMQDVVQPKSVTYWREEKILDIEKDIQRRLQALTKAQLTRART